MTINNDFNLLFNFKNIKEFKEKININYLSTIWNIEKKYCYERIFATITSVLHDLDINTSQYFYNKYWKTIKKCLQYETIKKFAVTIYDEPETDIEIVFNNFLEEYCDYILSATSTKIDQNIILTAANNIK